VPQTADPLSTPVNVIIVLDSSGSMRETPDARDSGDTLGLVDSPAEGELVGDDPSSKLAQAKQVLREVLKTATPDLRFHVARYRQSTAPEDHGPELRDRFLYSTTDPAAATLVVNPDGDGASPPGLRRSARDQRTAGEVTTYYLFAGRFWNGERIEVLPDGSGATVVSTGRPSKPATFDVQKKSRSGQRIGSPVRFSFRGARWNKANRPEDPTQRPAVLLNNASCSGIEPLFSWRQGDGELAPYLEPELRVRDDGSVEGYMEGSLGAPPAKPPTQFGIRASGLTPLAGALIDIRTRLASSYLAKDRTFVVLLTDGDDTCTDGLTGDLAVSRADQRALRAAYQAQQVREQAGTPVFVVTFGTGVSKNRSDWIAWAGTGLARETTGTGESTRWTRPPSASERAACRRCQDAFTASNAQELSAGLQRAIEAGSKWTGR
jgi:hypothetical protein